MAKQVFFVEQREDGRYNVTEKGANLSVVVNVVTVTEWKGKPLPGW